MFLFSANSVMEIRRRLGTIGRSTGETLRREGSHVYRVETGGSMREFFISEYGYDCTARKIMHEIMATSLK